MGGFKQQEEEEEDVNKLAMPFSTLEFRLLTIASCAQLPHCADRFACVFADSVAIVICDRYRVATYSQDSSMVRFLRIDPMVSGSSPASPKLSLRVRRVTSSL